MPPNSGAWNGNKFTYLANAQVGSPWKFVRMRNNPPESGVICQASRIHFFPCRGDVQVGQVRARRRRMTRYSVAGKGLLRAILRSQDSTGSICAPPHMATHSWPSESDVIPSGQPSAGGTEIARRGWQLRRWQGCNRTPSRCGWCVDEIEGPGIRAPGQAVGNARSGHERFN